jgi:hypothetical protein
MAARSSAVIAAVTGCWWRSWLPGAGVRLGPYASVNNTLLTVITSGRALSSSWRPALAKADRCDGRVTIMPVAGLGLAGVAAMVDRVDLHVMLGL